MSRQAARHGGGFHAAFVEAAAGPISGDSEIVISIVQRRNPIADRARQRRRVAIEGLTFALQNCEVKLDSSWRGLAGSDGSISSSPSKRRRSRPRARQMRDVAIEKPDRIVAHDLAASR